MGLAIWYNLVNKTAASHRRVIIMTIVINSNGASIDYDAAVELMDDNLREEVAADLAPCTEQEFFTEYCKRYAAKFGETWELDKSNPTY